MAEYARTGIISDFRGLARLWPDLRQHKALVTIAIILIPIVSALQTAMPLLMQKVIDHGVLVANWDWVLYGGFGFLAMVLLEYLARGGQSYLTALAVHKMIRSLRERLVAHILRLKLAYHDKNLSGALVTRATSDFDNLSESLNLGVLTSVVDIAVLLGCIVGMFALNAKLAWVAIAFLPVVIYIVNWFSAALKRAMLGARSKIAALNAFAQECLYGHATVKLLVAEDAASERYHKLNIDYRDTQMTSVVLDAWLFSILDGIASITIGIILYFSVSWLSPGSSLITAGVVVAYVQLVGQMFEPLKNLGSKIAMLQSAFTAIERIFGILDEKQFIEGSLESTQTLRGAIEFRKVNFRYQSSEKSTLSNISFVVPPGSSMALVGRTGSGKSSIIRLLCKLYDGFSGEILLDGKSLAGMSPESVRQQVAMVPQDLVIFDGNVRFNIGLGKADEEAIRNAAQAVGAMAFIERLPGGFDFELKEQGVNLSQGQRQLLVFARALVRNPAVLVLDEATSAVDPESEALIKAATALILKGRTVVVIAHRLSTIEQCDQILVLEHGEIVESGNHAELLARQGAYYRLSVGESSDRHHRQSEREANHTVENA